MRLLEEQGPARGYYPEPEKSIFVPSTPEVAMEYQDRLRAHNFQHRPGHRYIGGFIGTDAARSEWLEPQIQQWIRGIHKLS